MIALDRTDRRPFSAWLWTIDLWSLGSLIALSLLGIILSFAASPAVAQREHYDSLHFVTRQLIFLGPSLLVLVGASLMSPRDVRRSAMLMLALSIVLLILTLAIGVDVKGARRWLDVAGLRLQASEFVKPAFVVVAAYLFAEGIRRASWVPYAIAGTLYAAIIVLLIRQPDFGQSTLITATFCVMIFSAGVSWIVIAALAALGLGGVMLAYYFLPHVTSRIDRFVSDTGDTFQIDRARDAIMNGGLTGVGPGEGVFKRILPDAHTDMIAAVGIEEYGLMLGVLLIGLFGFVVLRGLLRAYGDGDRCTRLAATGLFVMFGLQALINLGVILRLLPAKGMTLPFVSYGGSSLIAVGIGMGFALALTRRRAKAHVSRDFR